MKKFLILAAFVLAVACSREEQFATLSFGLRGVEEHSITKSYVEDVRTLIAANTPTTVTLTLTRVKTGKNYSVATGENITLPVGEYTVKGSITPTSVTGFPRQGMWAANTASISINETVEVVSGTDTYALTPTFTCFAVAALEDCASYTYAHSNASGSVTGSGIKLRFFGWDNDYELAFTAKPVSYDTSEDTRFVFGGTGVKATNGKFYVLHPEAVTTEEGGFTFNIADWTEGAL